MQLLRQLLPLWPQLYFSAWLPTSYPSLWSWFQSHLDYTSFANSSRVLLRAKSSSSKWVYGYPRNRKPCISKRCKSVTQFYTNGGGRHFSHLPPQIFKEKNNVRAIFRNLLSSINPICSYCSSSFCYLSTIYLYRFAPIW